MKDTTKDSQESINGFYKQSKFFYLADLIIIAVIIILCCTFYFAFKTNDGDTVEIFYKNDLIFTQKLDKDGEFLFDKHGKNLIIIKSGKVSIQFSDCPNQICKHSKAISLAGEVIICAPHYLSVKISGKNSLDGVTG